MSYRDEREALLKKGEREEKEVYKEFLEQTPEDSFVGMSYQSDERLYDKFFRALLLLKHAIITEDLMILPDDFFEHMNDLVVGGKDSFFSRAPLTIAGLKEYYAAVIEEIKTHAKDFYPRIEDDIQTAIGENVQKYEKAKYAKPKTNYPSLQPAPALKRDELPHVKLLEYPPINYEKIPPRATFETFKEYKEDMHAYNFAHANEAKLFRIYVIDFIEKRVRKLFPDLRLENPYPRYEEKQKLKQGRGDYLNLRDGLFMLIDKCSFGKMSFAKYADTIMPTLEKDGFIKNAISPDAFSKFIRDSNILELLEKMSYESAIEMREFERVFAMDGTGFNSQKKGDYYANKHHKSKETEWYNLEALTGVRSGMIVCSSIYFKYTSSERESSIPVIKGAQDLGYKVEELLGDKLYAVKEYRKIIHDMGVERYYCEFPKNYNPPTDNDHSVWAKQYREWQDNSEEFYAHYHKRSKVESVFGAIKKRCSENLSSLSYDACVKELYGKIIYYNLCCMIKQAFVNGIIPDYVKKEEILAVLKKK